MNRRDVKSAPVTTENEQISLARFTNLRSLAVFGYDFKHFKSLQAILRSWNPTEVPSRHLELYFSWEDIQSVQSCEDVSSLGQNASILEESCGSVFANGVHPMSFTDNIPVIV